MRSFSIYRLAILNKPKEEQVLSYFNGTSDLFEVTVSFYKSLSEEKRDYYDTKGNKRTFSISTDFNVFDEERYVLSNLDSAYTGEDFEIRDGFSNSLSYSVSKNDLQNRKLFSLIYIPKKRKYGYVVFENKSNHGVKSIFENQFNKFLKEEGFLESKLELTSGLNFKYLSNMIEKGTLKKVRLINYTFSQSIQLSLWNKLNIRPIGEEVRELKFKNKIKNETFKLELYKLFFSKDKIEDKIDFRGQYDVDEISFEMNYNSSTKTFYVRDKSKMRPNIDVQKLLDFIDDDPTYESMKRVAFELIDQIEGYNFDDLEVA